MRNLDALVKFAKKITGKNTIPGSTIDEVIDYMADNANITARGLVLKSPDNSLWDISIANDGTISGTKRT